MLFCWGENGNLRAWTIGGNGAASYLACSAEVASAQSPVPPGGMMCLSADCAASNTAVLWACIPYLDANTVVSPGRLLAYDATSFGTFGDGSKQLQSYGTARIGTSGSAFANSLRRSSPTASSMYRPTMRASTFTGWPRGRGGGSGLCRRRRTALSCLSKSSRRRTGLSTICRGQHSNSHQGIRSRSPLLSLP
jgi:hypothetical protein